MGEWIEIVIGNYAEVLPGYAFDSTYFSDKSKGVPLIRIRDLKKKETEINFDGKYPNRYLVNKNDILIGMDGDFHVVRWNGQNALLNQRVCKITAKSELDNGLLYYFLIGELLKIQNQTTGTTVKHLSNGDVAEIKLKIPKDKQEQSAIATTLTTIDQAINKTKQLIGKYGRIKTGLMQDLLTCGIDKQGNIRSEETHEFKDSVLGRIPKDWEVGGIGNFCYVTKLAGFEFTNYLKYIEDGEIIALRALNIKNEKLDLSNVQRVSRKVSDSLTRSKLYAGDILITYIGAYIGDILQIKENDKYHLAPNIAKIVPPDYIVNNFLEIYLRSYSVQMQMKNATATTATPSLTMRQIRSLNIAFPKDKNEQKRIVDAIYSVNLNLKNNEENYENLKRLKTALMQDLLTGKVRVDALLKK